ncbi:MAG: heme exporter protein CcmD [Lysobacter sp.]|nr:heme exporter protein CcmD [Lysobacter sp.]
MTYLPYVVAAYCVFAVVLGWDYLAPRLQVRAQLRAAQLRAARRKDVPRAPDAPLSRE